MPAVNPVLLSDARILAAYLIFFGSYFVFALGKFPGMKIDRPGAAIIGAVLMVAFRILGPRDAIASLDFATRDPVLTVARRSGDKLLRLFGRSPDDPITR